MVKDYILFAYFIPWLPRFISRFMLNSNLVLIFRVFPIAIMLPIRFCNALFRKGDILGRIHIKNLFKIAYLKR